MDLTAIFWLPLVVAAILGGSVPFPEAGERAARGPHRGVGPWLAASGSIATLAGLWIWITSVEQRSQSFGTAVFLIGSAGAFVGLQLVGRNRPGWKGH